MVWLFFSKDVLQPCHAVVGLMLSLVACRAANLAFLKQDFEILALYDAFASQNRALSFLLFFFSQKGLSLAKPCLSCIFITNLLWREHMIMQDARYITKILLLLWKRSIYLIRNKMHDSLFTVQENASKIGIALYRCFWRVLIHIFVWLYMFYA